MLRSLFYKQTKDPNTCQTELGKYVCKLEFCV